MKKLLTEKLPRVNSTHSIFLVIIAAYIGWMGYKMIQNTRSGVSTMSMTTTIILAAIMGIVALLIFAYALFIFYQAVKNDPPENNTEGEELPPANTAEEWVDE